MSGILGGSCQVPIGGHATINNQQLTLIGMVGSIDGKNIIRSELSGALDDAALIGKNVADDLLSKGADKILQKIHAAQ